MLCKALPLLIELNLCSSLVTHVGAKIIADNLPYLAGLDLSKRANKIGANPLLGDEGLFTLSTGCLKL